MERHPIIRKLFILMLALGLVFALGACGGITDADALLEDTEQVEETLTEEPTAGEEPGSEPGEEEGGAADDGAGDEGEGAGDEGEGSGDEGEGSGEGDEGEGDPEGLEQVQRVEPQPLDRKEHGQADEDIAPDREGYPAADRRTAHQYSSYSWGSSRRDTPTKTRIITRRITAMAVPRPIM